MRKEISHKKGVFLPNVYRWGLVLAMATVTSIFMESDSEAVLGAVYRAPPTSSSAAGGGGGASPNGSRPVSSASSNAARSGAGTAAAESRSPWLAAHPGGIHAAAAGAQNAGRVRGPRGNAEVIKATAETAPSATHAQAGAKKSPGALAAESRQIADDHQYASHLQDKYFGEYARSQQRTTQTQEEIDADADYAGKVHRGEVD